jgi:hypothetical protein
VSLVTPWNLALVAVVMAMMTAMALLRDPRRKALVMTLPLPFTVASLTLGTPLDAAHVAALSLLFLYTLGVYVLHRRAHLPLLLCILLMAAAFLGSATLLNARLPRTDASFWTVCALTLVAGVLLLTQLRRGRGVGRVSELPLALKLTVSLVVVVGLVVLKETIGGFMTLFPMVGVLASYENRDGLWENVLQMPVVMVTLLPLMITSHLTVADVGLGASLALGWVPFALAVVPFIVLSWRRTARPAGSIRAEAP